LSSLPCPVRMCIFPAPYLSFHLLSALGLAVFSSGTYESIPVVLSWGRFCSQRTLTMARGISVVLTEGGATDIWWEDRRDAAQSPWFGGQTLTTKNYPVQSVSSAEAEKPCSIFKSSFEIGCHQYFL
jgi:hypothetical protein